MATKVGLVALRVTPFTTTVLCACEYKKKKKKKKSMRKNDHCGTEERSLTPTCQEFTIMVPPSSTIRASVKVKIREYTPVRGAKIAPDQTAENLIVLISW